MEDQRAPRFPYERRKKDPDAEKKKKRQMILSVAAAAVILVSFIVKDVFETVVQERNDKLESLRADFEHKKDENELREGLDRVVSKMCEFRTSSTNPAAPKDNPIFCIADRPNVYLTLSGVSLNVRWFLCRLPKAWGDAAERARLEQRLNDFDKKLQGVESSKQKTDAAVNDNAAKSALEVHRDTEKFVTQRIGASADTISLTSESLELGGEPYALYGKEKSENEWWLTKCKLLSYIFFFIGWVLALWGKLFQVSGLEA